MLRDLWQVPNGLFEGFLGVNIFVGEPRQLRRQLRGLVPDVVMLHSPSHFAVVLEVLDLDAFTFELPLSLVSLSVGPFRLLTDNGVQPIYRVELSGGHARIHPISLVSNHMLLWLRQL